MFDDLDFSKLKLPIEPQNLIYIYLAYKLINNLDNLNMKGFSKPKPPPPSANNFIFLVLIIIGCSFIFFNNILNRISISSISMENASRIKETNPTCPLKDTTKCPLRVCPLFTSTENMKELLSKCIPKETNPQVNEV